MRPRPLIPILLTILLTIPATAATHHTDTAVTPATALQVARHFLPTATTNTTTLITDHATPLYYLITLQPTGYIIVTADTRLPPILAYSTTTAPDTPDDPDHTLLTLATTDLHQRLTHLTSLPPDLLRQRADQWTQLIAGTPTLPSTFRQWPRLGTTTDGGWLETTWTQKYPYNLDCPIDLATHDRSVAGCPAVAMAQILNYHQTTNTIAFNDTDDYLHDYAGNTFTIDDDHATYDFPSFPALDTDLETLTHHYQTQTPLTIHDKAALVFACGVAAHQVYSPQGSGTYGVDQALQAYHRFGFINVTLLTQNTTDTYTQIQDDLKVGLPVHYACVNQNWTAGHNFVVDGYNTDGYYHCNFGWGGPMDGWYLLPQDSPQPHLPRGRHRPHPRRVRPLPPQRHWQP